MTKTCVSNMTLCPRIAPLESSGGALNHTKSVSGAKPARIIAAIAKVIRTATAVCLNDNPDPRICANIPLIAPLPRHVRKITSGNFIAV
jgi:hypothetical protein